MSYLIFAHLGSFWDIVPSFVISKWCARLSQRRKKRGFHKQYKSSRMVAMERMREEEERRIRPKSRFMSVENEKQLCILSLMPPHWMAHCLWFFFSNELSRQFWTFPASWFKDYKVRLPMKEDPNTVNLRLLPATAQRLGRAPKLNSWLIKANTYAIRNLKLFLDYSL